MPSAETEDMRLTNFPTTGDRQGRHARNARLQKTTKPRGGGTRHPRPGYKTN